MLLILARLIRPFSTQSCVVAKQAATHHGEKNVGEHEIMTCTRPPQGQDKMLRESHRSEAAPRVLQNKLAKETVQPTVRESPRLLSTTPSRSSSSEPPSPYGRLLFAYF